MRAVVYKEPFKVAVENVDDPRIQHPNDVLVRVTSTYICGSDLHMYEGRTAAKPGIVFGHENMGIIEEVGDAVTSLRAGDRVVMPFNVGCGFCTNCQRGFTGFCLTANPDPGFAGAAYGYVAMGPYTGGQAEYLRVPYADFNCLLLPPGDENEADFSLLADIFPTGYHGTELADVRPGETVVVFGAGPVGLMAAYSAMLRGASQVFVVDRVKERLDKAEEIGCTAVNFDEVDPVEYIKDQTPGTVCAPRRSTTRPTAGPTRAWTRWATRLTSAERSERTPRSCSTLSLSAYVPPALSAFPGSMSRPIPVDPTSHRRKASSSSR